MALKEISSMEWREEVEMRRKLRRLEAVECFPAEVVGRSRCMVGVGMEREAVEMNICTVAVEMNICMVGAEMGKEAVGKNICMAEVEMGCIQWAGVVGEDAMGMGVCTVVVGIRSGKAAAGMVREVVVRSVRMVGVGRGKEVEVRSKCTAVAVVMSKHMEVEEMVEAEVGTSIHMEVEERVE